MRSPRTSCPRLARSFAAICVTATLFGCGAADDARPSQPTGSGVPDASSSPAPDRVLADEDGVGRERAIVVFHDEAAFGTWWAELGFPDEVPRFEPDRELVIGFTATYGSGCQYGFAELLIDDTVRTVEGRYFGNEPASACGADENPFTTVVAIDRASLPAGAWSVQMSVGGATAMFDVP